MAQRRTWREKLACDNGLPKVGRIEGRMSKRFGTGTMVIPAPREVDAMMRRVKSVRTVSRDKQCIYG